MNKQAGRNTWVYVIDDDFRIIYSNKKPKNNISQTQLEQPCYQVIHQESSPCQKCPFQEGSRGRAIFFDRLQDEWANINASRIEWPGIGQCHLLLCDRVDEKDQSVFYDSSEQAGYCAQLHNRKNFFKCIENKLKQSSGSMRWCLIAMDI